jgi:hypothetical protein
MRWCIALLAALALVACDQRPSARIGGDAGGVPLTVAVTYDREALALLTGNGAYQRTVVIDRDPFLYGGFGRYPSHHAPYGCPPYGFVGAGWYGPSMAYEPSTSLFLLVGRGPAEAQYLRVRLVPGTWEWPLTVSAGTEVTVSLQATGGRSGWTEIGRFTAAAGQRVAIALEGAQPTLTVNPPSVGLAR